MKYNNPIDDFFRKVSEFVIIYSEYYPGICLKRNDYCGLLGILCIASNSFEETTQLFEISFKTIHGINSIDSKIFSYFNSYSLYTRFGIKFFNDALPLLADCTNPIHLIIHDVKDIEEIRSEHRMHEALS